jgi:hypothetical protein
MRLPVLPIGKDFGFFDLLLPQDKRLLNFLPEFRIAGERPIS